MSFRLFVILLVSYMFTAILISSCSDQITQIERSELSDETTFIPYSSADTLVNRAKGIPASEPPSDFGCSLSTLNEENADQRYRYQAFYIQFPEEVKNSANGQVTHRTFMLKSNRAEDRTSHFLNQDGVVRYLTCQIPNAPKAADILEEEMQKFGDKSWYNDVAPPGKTIPNRESDSYNTPTTGEMVWTCKYVPGDGYGNTSTTITVGDQTYTTYYFHEECSYEYVPDDSPQQPGVDGEFGGGDGDVGGGGDIDSPDPCASTEGELQYENGDIIGCGNLSINEEELEAEIWEQRIDDTDLDPCMQDELNKLREVEKGVGEIVQKFANSSDELGYNWKVKNGNLPQNTNGRTSQQYNSTTGTVTTTFDAGKFGQATDLAVARTMLHESVHAYLLAYSKNSPLEFRKNFAQLLQDYNDLKYGGNANSIQHAEFARNFVNDIALALMGFGSKMGYNLAEQYYKDLAWGGLTHYKNANNNTVLTPFFKNAVTSTNARNRIINNILVEQTGKDNNGNFRSQKGNNSGC